MALTLIGAAMLWFGWFGFNVGLAVAADASAGMAMAVGAVAGLVGITPAVGFVAPGGWGGCHRHPDYGGVLCLSSRD